MKILKLTRQLILLLFILLTAQNTGLKAQEAVLINETINWQWQMPQWYGGNSFYWWHRTDVNPDIIDFGEMSATDWTTPYNYLNGTFYFRFQIVSQPTATPFTVQFGIWQDINKPGGWSETCSALSALTGGAGTSVQKSIGSPANWWQLRTDAKVDFTRPEDFYRIGILLWKGNGSCIPYAQGWTPGSSQCANPETEAANYFPMVARLTVVAVAQGQTFSGWANYPVPGGTIPSTPTYSVDFTNELTNKVVPSTDEYSYSSNMTGAVSGTGQKLALTPGQDVYFRTKAAGSTPASNIQSLDVPSRPATPSFTYDAANQRTSTIVSSAFEYSTSSSMSGAVSGTGTYVNFASGTTMYFRQKATSSAFKSNIQTLVGTAVPPSGNSEFAILNAIVEWPNATDPNGFFYFPYNSSMPVNWLSPYDFYNGRIYTRFEIISQVSSEPVSFQFGIWQRLPDENGTLYETQSPLSTMSGPGSIVSKNSSPTGWWKLGGVNIDWTQMDKVWHFGINPWKNSTTLISPDYPATWDSRFTYWYPMQVRVIVVAVASGYTFSGWENYLNAGTKPPTPNYSIDFAGELTNTVVPATDEYANNSGMTGAVSGTGVKLVLTPGQNVYFRTKASGNNPASDVQTLIVPARPATPNFSYDAVNQRTSTTVSSAYEYSTSVSMSGAVSGTGTYVSFSIGTTRYFRLKSTLSAFKSNVQALTGSAVSQVRIMPLGNSITFDNRTVENRPVGDRIGYRYHLYNLLNHADHDFDFVGSEIAGNNFFPDAENAGFPGITTSQVTQLLNSGYNAKDAVQETPGPYLDYYLPDIILLHIGTNNVQESAAEVQNILNEIDAYKLRTGKDTKIILARIINRQTYNQTTTTFNNNVASMALGRNDPDIYFVDMENGAGINYALDLIDNIHPNNTGYQKMALAWFGKLAEILPPKTYMPEILVAPVSNGSVNTAYNSRAYAIGNPAPAFSLVSAPSGMSINAQTGVINWLPGSTGDFAVTLRATNSSGYDEINFVITVAANTKTIGYTSIFASTSTTSNRRAQPVIMTENGTINSIAIYHSGGTGNVLVGVYSTSGVKPSQRLAISAPTAANASAGWQTINLISPANVLQGDTAWLAWVFETNVTVRYQSGTPGRALSSLNYTSGLPDNYGGSSLSNYIYSVYANYVAGSAPEIPQAPSALVANAISSSQINLTWTDNATNEHGFQIERSTVSGSGFQLVYTTGPNQTSYSDPGLDAAQTYYYRIRAFINQSYSGYTPEQQATTQGSGGGTAIVGFNEIFTSLSPTLNRRAQPVIMTENGAINSIAIYHSGGTGNVLVGVYSTSGVKPAQRLAISAPTAVSASEGWQTINLTSPAIVSQGDTAWLAWVFESSVNVRYRSGTPGRAMTSSFYASGLPATFGYSSILNSIYSVYANYSPLLAKSTGNNTDSDIPGIEGLTVNAPVQYEFEVYPTIVKTGFTVKLVLPESNFVSIGVYTMMGSKLKDVVNKTLDKGEYNLYVDDLPKLSNYSGSKVLFVRMLINNSVEVRKIVLSDE